MLSSVLSALLLGMFPAFAGPAMGGGSPLTAMAIAPPAQKITLEHRLSASGVLVMDADTGQRLYAYQADVERPMASITKLMTALVIVENHDLSEWVTIPAGIAETKGNVVYLKSGEQFRVGDLLSALLISSANDAAVALAQFHSGSVSAFVKEMNLRAKSLGLRSTEYANPMGLDSPRQWSTPQDIAWLTASLQRFPEIRSRMSRPSATIVSRGDRSISLSHTHALLHVESPVVSGKTGTTEEAGQCLVSVVEKEGRHYVVVLLHSLRRYGDMNAILQSLNEPPAFVGEPQECVSAECLPE